MVALSEMARTVIRRLVDDSAGGPTGLAIDPSEVGREHRVVLGKHSGRAAARHV